MSRCLISALGVALLLVLPSCTPGPNGRRAGRDAVAVADVATLRQRAETLWTARVHDDCGRVFELLDPATRGESTVDQFCEWYRNNEPFRMRSYTLRNAAIDGTLGWVAVDYNATVRKFPGTPARDAQAEEKWHVIAGRWYPLPRTLQEGYPAAPWRRDAPQETKLRERYEQFWQARQQNDWQKLFDLTDPRDRAESPEVMMPKGPSPVEYLSRHVEWVEVIGPQGRVRVLYVIKLTDPNMTKAEPKSVYVTERWIRHEGEWYVDLKL